MRIDIVVILVLAIALASIIMVIIGMTEPTPPPLIKTEEQLLLDSLYLAIEDVSDAVRAVTRQLNALCLVIADAQSVAEEFCGTP